MKKGSGLFALFILLWSLSASAEPNSTADRFLTDTPSMMDWGLMRLQDKLRSYQGEEDPRDLEARAVTLLYGTASMSVWVKSLPT